MVAAYKTVFSRSLVGHPLCVTAYPPPPMVRVTIDERSLSVDVFVGTYVISGLAVSQRGHSLFSSGYAVHLYQQLGGTRTLV